MICHRYECEVAFSDTDASGWAHFSKILVYVERAEHAFLVLSGIEVFDASSGGWPRARISCDYRSPVRFGDDVEVRLSLSEVGKSSLQWRFEIYKDSEILVAEGEMVSVKVDTEGRPAAILGREREKLEASR